MPEYRSNSERSKESQGRENPSRHKVEKVVSSAVQRRQKSGLSKALDMIIPGDLEETKAYVFRDVIVPSILRMINDVVCNSIGMLTGISNSGKGGVPAGRVAYRQYYPSDDRPNYARPKVQSEFSYDDLVFSTRGDAEQVLWSMEDMLTNFDAVSIADFFDLAGVSSNYTDNKYGWTDLRMAHVERANGGYVIRLPRATAL